jgi:hypothetical protein
MEVSKRMAKMLRVWWDISRESEWRKSFWWAAQVVRWFMSSLLFSSLEITKLR